MTKIRLSQIPEESGEPKYIKNVSSQQTERLLDRTLGDIEARNEGDEEKPQYIKTVIHLSDIGMVLSLHDINSIEKTFRLQSSDYYPDKVTQLYGISINRGMEPSMRFPKTNIELWFEKEEVRDQRYEKMMKAFKEAGFKFIEI